MDSSEALYMNPRYVRRMADGGDTGMTGQSDEYYRYLMGLAPAPRPAVYAPPAAYTPVGSSASSISEALAPSAQLVRGNSRPYYDNSLSGEAPTPVNPDFMYDPNTGQLTPIVSALASIGNTLGINTPQQGALGGLPGLLMGNPLGILAGAAVGNAVQGANMLSLHNSMVEANGGKPIEGLPTPGQMGFVSGLPGAMAQMTSNASSQVNDEINASLAANAAANANAADSEDAAMGEAIAAAVAAAEANNAAAVAESNGNPDSAPSDGGGDAAAGAAAGADAGGIGGDLARGGLAGLAAFANGGYNLGGYSDGGRLLRGPGDGVSDSIPATIADRQPARLADGEFVVPARIVSELGNGSTDAGARKLYAMLDRVQRGRAKTTGKGKVAVNSRADKYLPA
jgi:hypothetical protein